MQYIIFFSWRDFCKGEYHNLMAYINTYTAPEEKIDELTHSADDTIAVGQAPGTRNVAFTTKN